ncbi:DUF2490 domain-containing protein [Fibrella sp. HMF5335]|uniref:DUF2490 domain-containing protein n=1 Tax=Fibrella rubiginis TaxID=2817060 RepID=A0A939GFX1_9BACT|nr:DUF2490 domain-containing protein [Fibrella rubiginis]MBO0938412.1 DUF2490 domain-containing protein [Fibrella rubiginis]
MHNWLLILALFALAPLLVNAQPARITDHNAIGWFTYNGDHKLTRNWAIHTEVQWRRTDLITNWQQALYRLGLVYKTADKIQLSGGYTALVTYPYGNHPVAETGVPFTEHRAYEDITVTDTVGTVNLSHRLRLEQRWLANLMPGGSREVAGWSYQNRVRYQLQARVPLQGRTLDNREWYAFFYDELFIGFGKNVGNNVFNQNRISGGLGYRFSDALNLELGYLNQITQHADNDPATGKPVFENNNGFRLNVVYDW